MNKKIDDYWDIIGGGCIETLPISKSSSGDNFTANGLVVRIWEFNYEN